MKVAIVLAFVTIIAHLCSVSCAPKSTKIEITPSPVGVTTTTPKSWGQKFKSGLDNFFRGAAVVGAVNGAFAGRGGKHKQPLPTNPKH